MFLNIFFSLVSVTLALNYLDKDEFGLWALVTQLAGYLMLMEFGMTGAVARSLSDHKDHFEGGVYGSILRTGSRVFAIQGGLVAISGIALAWFAAPFLGVPSTIRDLFTILMAAQAVWSGIRLSVTSLGAVSYTLRTPPTNIRLMNLFMARYRSHSITQHTC